MRQPLSFYLRRAQALTIAVIVLLAGCGSEVTPTPDTVATQVAMDRAVAATLTALPASTAEPRLAPDFNSTDVPSLPRSSNSTGSSSNLARSSGPKPTSGAIVAPSPTSVGTKVPAPGATQAAGEGVFVRSSVGYATYSNYEVAGEVVNQSATSVRRVKLLVQLYDEQGQLLKTDEFHASLGILKAGEASPFGETYGDLPRPVERYEVTLVGWETTAKESLRPDMVRHEGAEDDGGCYRVWGEVQNPRDVETSWIMVYATFYDSAGEVIGVGYAVTDLWTLEPGQHSTFEIRQCDMPGVVESYAVVAVDVQL